MKCAPDQNLAQLLSQSSFKDSRYSALERLNTAMTDHRHLLDTHPNPEEFGPFFDGLNKESNRGTVLPGSLP